MNSPWLQTLGSGAFDLVHPRADQLDRHTMACVLARIPRFGGHTDRGVYSVAQHLEQGAYAILRDTGRCDAAGAFVIHDTHEYAVGDVTRPEQDALVAIAIEESGDLGAGEIVRRAFKEQKRRIDAVIYPYFGLPWPLPADVHAIVKEYDARMCQTERLARLAPSPHHWPEYEHLEPVAGVDLTPWPEGVARALWLAAVADLLPLNSR